ncbi:MAG TPA: 6-pyruvoyl-tetrahydropterin synthase-related protein, partial [Nitrolancea sp.]|nr:6-pyruvoyl-tetrahydropterin synthase-related protein [Nitrolancea sp.]
MAALPSVDVEESVAPASRGLPEHDIEQLIAAVVLLVAIGFSAFFLAPEATIRVPPLNDHILHIAAAQQAATALSHGHDPTDPWFARIGLGYPLFRHYQHLEYIPLAVINVLSGHAISIQALIDWSTVIMLSLFPLSIFWSMRRFGFGLLAAAFSGLAAPLLATNGLYGFDFASYVWRGYGLYTQLWGMFLLPLALALGYQLLRTGRGYFPATLLLVLTLLCHTVYGYLAIVALGVIALVLCFDERVLADSWRRFWLVVRRLVLLFGLTALAGSYFLVPFLLDGTYMNRSVWEYSYKYNSFGADSILTWFRQGDLFDYGRLPVLTLLVVAGLVICIVRWRESLYRLPPILFGVWLALYFGKPTWGTLLNLLPLSHDMQFHRLIGGVHMAGLLLIGVALAAPWPWLLRRPKIWPALVAGLVLIAVLVPAFRERADYLRVNADFMRQQQAASALDQPDLDALIAKLRSLPPGRVYAGFAGGWGKGYRVGSIPMYSELQMAGFDMVGYLYHSLSLSSDVEAWFDDSKAYEYNLFNVRYVVAPTGQVFPNFVKPIGTYGRHTLYQVDTTGYFDLVQAPLTLTGHPDELYATGSSWLKGAEPALKQAPRVILNGDAPSDTQTMPLSNAVTSVAAPIGNPSIPKGEIEAESIDLNGRYAATIRADQPATVMLKITYDPNFRVTVDGRRVTPIMLLPSFIGVPVTAGTHQVVVSYAPSPLRLWLQLLGVLTLAGTVVVERKRATLGRWSGSLAARPLVEVLRDRVDVWVEDLRASARVVAFRRELPALIGVGALVLLAGLPLLQLKLMAGHDVLEYLPRNEEFYKLLSSGNLLPRWAPDLSAGHGQPFFAFNPPLIYYLSSAFHALGFTFVAAGDLTSLTLMLLAGFGMYLLGRSFFGVQGGLVASAAYLFAPYFLVALYVRHSLTDFAAFAFLPFIFWGVYRYGENGRYRYLLIGSLGLALLMLSSNPVALMLVPFLGVLVVVPAYLSRRWSVLLRGLLACGLGLGLSAFFWLPAVLQRGDVHVERLLQGMLKYSNNFVYLRQLLYSPWGYGTSVPGTHDGMSFQLGPVHILLLVAALTLFARIRASSERAAWMTAILAAVALGAALLTTNLAWPIWKPLTLLHYLEFPWRFLTLAAFATAFVAGFPLLLLREQRRLASWVAAGLIGLLILFGLPHAKPSGFLPQTDAQYTPQMIRSQNLAVTTTREYEPIWVQRSPTGPAATPLSFVEGSGEIKATGGSETKQRYDLTIDEPALLRAATSYFPGWRLTVDGKHQSLDYDRATGEMLFRLSPGAHRVSLELKPTPLQVRSAALSLLALALLLLVGLAPWLGVNRVIADVRARRWPEAAPSTAGDDDPPAPPDDEPDGNDVSAGGDVEASRTPAETPVSMPDPVDVEPPLRSAVERAPERFGPAVSFRLKAGIYLLFLTVYLVTGPGHFYSTDHIAVYLTTQSLVDDHSLAIKPIARAVVGRDGKTYGRYGLLQSVVAIPLYELGTTVDAHASPAMRNLLAGPDLGDWGGTVPIFFVSLLNAFVTPFTCLLLFLFAVRLGFSRP